MEEIDIFNPSIKLDRRKRKLYHYLYLIAYSNGWFYIGQRQHHDPENDDYVGSGIDCEFLNNYFGHAEYTKYIIKIFPYNIFAVNLWETLLIRKAKEISPRFCLNILDGPPFGILRCNPACLPEVQKKMSDALYKRYEDPVKRENVRIHLNNIKDKRLAGIAKSESWTDERKENMSDFMKINNPLFNPEIAEKCANGIRRYNKTAPSKRGLYINITNGNENTKHLKVKEIPQGWWRAYTIKNKRNQDGENNPMHGRTGEFCPMSGKMWITNGVEEKSVKKDYVLEKGWKKGRKKVSKETINKMKGKRGPLKHKRKSKKNK